MKKVTSLILVFSLFLNLGFAQILRNEQPIRIRLLDEIYSDSETPQSPSFVVDKDVIDFNTDKVLIRKDTPVMVNCIVKKSNAIGKPGEIMLDIISTEAVDGRVVDLRGFYSEVGKNKQGLALGLGVGLGVFIFPAFLCLLIKGEAVYFPPGMLIHNVVVGDNYKIDVIE